MKVKICGLSTPASVAWAVDAGAAYVGFNFFARSPRNVSIAQARDLALQVPGGICKVAVTVDATDAELEAILAEVRLDFLQLHGRESPDRVTDVKAKFSLPVIKAVGIANAADLPAIAAYSRVADQLLIDAKPPKGAALPGGNALAFDWRLISGRRWAVPWMLAGGLTPDNVAEAVRLTGAEQLDVSSGVESAPGVKDNDKIAGFISAARGD